VIEFNVVKKITCISTNVTTEQLQHCIP
jgi:hypothetical protein